MSNTSYGKHGFLVFDARYGFDSERDKAVVMDTLRKLPTPEAGKKLVAAYGECVVADRDNPNLWQRVNAKGELEDWSDELDALIVEQAEKGLDLYGKPLDFDEEGGDNDGL